MRLIHYAYPNASLPTSGLFVRHPWAGFENEIDRLFSQIPVGLHEDKDNVYVRAELPGVKREDIGVETLDDHLTITASRKQPNAGQEESVSSTRTVAIPEGTQADKIAASYENGVLTVTLPKSEAPKPRKIEVS